MMFERFWLSICMIMPVAWEYLEDGVFGTGRVSFIILSDRSLKQSICAGSRSS
jgi:hypothetical protein